MLIIATGILTLLAVLAFSFVNLMRIERRASTNYMDGFRANMTAESGLIRALEEMRIFSGRQVVYDPTAEWIYERDPATGSPRYDIRLVDAEEPSMEGDMGATYNGGLDRYRVKIVDTQALIDINHPNDFDRLMDQLGAAIAKYASQADNQRNPIEHVEYMGEMGGAAFLAFRHALEGQRFSSKSELLDLYAQQDSYAGEDAVEDFKLLSNYVTAHTWRDKLAASPSTAFSSFGTANLEALFGRAPININAASKVVLATIIAGIGGRVPLVYVEESPQLIDLDYAFGSSTDQIKIEDRYSFRSGWMFIPPIDYTYTTGDTVQYTLNTNLTRSGQIADIIISGRQAAGGITSHAHLRKILENAGVGNSSDPFQAYNLNDHIDPSIQKAGPVDDGTGEPNGDEFLALYRKGYLDMICANFNPNWVSAHHGIPSAYTVDKAELVRLHQANNGVVSSAKASMTTEACFNSQGIFEITSLGELVGEPNAGDYDALYAQAEIRTVIKVFDSKGHTSQEDFMTQWTDYTSARDNVLVRPDDPRFQDFGTSGSLYDRMGSIEIAPESLSVIVLGSDLAALEPQFVLTFQQEAQAANPRDLFNADMGAGQLGGNWATPDDVPAVASYKDVWEETPSAFPNTGLRLLDGLYTSEKGNFLGVPRLRSMLRYRAGADDYQTASNIGASDPRNIGSKKGALEFWYRPDHDWATNNKPTPVVSGLFHVSQMGVNEAQRDLYNQEQLCLGTQMFVTRNLSGQLRVTRLYFESVGALDANWPDQMHYRAPGEDVTAADAFAANFAGAALTVPVDLDEYVWHSEEVNMYWPPLDVCESQYTSSNTHQGAPFRGLWARTETAVRFDKLKHIEANEWHHFVVAWDDNAASSEAAVRIWLDGTEVTGSDKQSFGDESNADDLQDLENQPTRKNFRFVRLNQEAGAVWDVFTVGCVVREQALANTGVFKFDTDGNDKTVLLAANGTVDDVRVYHSNTPFDGAGGNFYPVANSFTWRYEDGLYENVLDLFDRFPASGYPLQLGVFKWTGYLPEGAEVIVNVAVLDSSGNKSRDLVVDYVWDDPEEASGIPLSDILWNDERIVYQFELLASHVQDTNGNFSESPVIDDVSVSYLTEAGGDVLLKERVYD